jgi:Leucine-rich repeat (LRR) protein
MNLIKYFIFLLPILASCQQYNSAPFDKKEADYRKLPESYNKLLLDKLWAKRDSLTYLRFKEINTVMGEVDSLPNWIYRFNKLEDIYLTGNSKKKNKLSKEIIRLEHLKHLNLIGLNIDSLPESIYHLSELQTINLDNNDLKLLNENISSLAKLTIISLKNNPIEAIPYSICNLNQLKSIILENTKISDLPSCLGGLEYLDWINVSGTQLKEFPIEILKAPKLTTIHARGLKLKNYKEVKAICIKKNITLYYDE